MIVSARETRVAIGSSSDPLRLLNFPYSEPLDFNYQVVGENHYVAAMDYGLATDSKINRLVGLLEKIELHDELIWQAYKDKPVLWLLPNLDTAELTQWVSILHQRFPHCFSHPQCRFFPQGSASLFFALNACELMQEQENSVVVISVDSLYFMLTELESSNVLVNDTQDVGQKPAEAAIITILDSTETGINIAGLFLENSSLVQQTQAIQNLFFQASQINKHVLKQLYLPSFDQTVTDNWLNAYEKLAGHIDEDSQINQTTNFTGHIGSAAGLYNFLHLFNRYQQHDLSGSSLQLEVSQTLHLGLAMYSWIEKA
ncbi:hypothetical protein [Shewanella glacialimarina]|uniref:hypothetical protein n=1 Tax=Shewanella glacialimarina TaxID=2590884 RepID=UPI001CF7F4FC|nr:hypothetical protein [Shewanella glacialimarina]UCX04450.1 hypothetical protein FJ709_08020 [Shewanella glacialimarina]